MVKLTARELELLRLAHTRPSLTRSQAALLMGASSGTVANLVGSLSAAKLLAEGPARSTGGRGRPTRELIAHPEGPLVLAGVIDHESWRLAAIEIGGKEVAAVAQGHDGRDARALVLALRQAGEDLATRFDGRVRGTGLAVPGLVQGPRLLTAPLLQLEDVDLTAAGVGDLPLSVSNDAAAGALAEAQRGAAAGAALHLHLHLDAGLGGALTSGGQLLTGVRGLAGEFGHMPFGDPETRCPCGARGCWTTSVSAEALAHTDDVPWSRHVVTRARATLAAARDGDPTARRTAAPVAGCLARGIAGLINALDVDLITLGGLAPALRAAAPEAFSTALDEGLMTARQLRPPGIVRAQLGSAAPQTGAAEHVWSMLWPCL